MSRHEQLLVIESRSLLTIVARPELGSLLGSLLDQVIVDPQLNTKQQLLNRVKDEVGRE